MLERSHACCQSPLLVILWNELTYDDFHFGSLSSVATEKQMIYLFTWLAFEPKIWTFVLQPFWQNISWTREYHEVSAGGMIQRVCMMEGYGYGDEQMIMQYIKTSTHLASTVLRWAERNK